MFRSPPAGDRPPELCRPQSEPRPSHRKQAVMASRLLNRHKLRAQADAAPAEAAAPLAAVPARKNAKAKVGTQPRPRKPRAKKPSQRMFARWGVFDSGMKQVAIFDYNQRD